ncbi:MAG TPA: type II CAAX endopeptidase family protein, partial [Terriglobia bacterium]
MDDPDPAMSTPPAQPDSRPVEMLVIRVFLGPKGIRAGWRLLIFLILTVIAGFALAVLIGPLVGEFKPPGILTTDAAGFLAALLASLVMARIENRSLADYGLPARGAFGAQFWLGALSGFAALTALLAVIHLGHGFDFGSVVLSGKPLVSYAALWGVTFLVVGLAEEYVFRGYALATLSTGMGFWPSAFLLSAAFGAGHIRNPGEDWTGALATALIGLFFCLTLRRT